MKNLLFFTVLVCCMLIFFSINAQQKQIKLDDVKPSSVEVLNLNLIEVLYSVGNQDIAKRNFDDTLQQIEIKNRYIDELLDKKTIIENNDNSIALNSNGIKKKSNIISKYEMLQIKDRVNIEKLIPNVILSESLQEASHSTIMDAIYIAENLKSLDKQKLNSFLMKNYNVNLDSSTISTDNPFLKEIIDYYSDKALNGSKTITNDNISKIYGEVIINSGSPFTPTNVANLLGTFIAERFKEEVNIAFLERFKKNLEKYEEFKALFPTTYSVLKDNNPYNYTIFFQTLREGINEDISTLPDNITTFSTNKLGIIKKRPVKEKVALAIVVFDIINDLSQKTALNKILINLKSKPYTDSLGYINNNYKALINLMSTLSYHLEDREHTNWVGVEFLKKLANDTNVQNVFIGLMLAKEHDSFDKINLKEDVTLTNFFKAKKNEIISNLKLINDFIIEVKIYNNLFDDIQKIEGEDTKVKAKASTAKYNALVSSVIKLIDITSNIIKIDTKLNLYDYVSVAKNSLSLIQHVGQKKFGLAFTDAVNTMEGLGYFKELKYNRDSVEAFDMYKCKITKINTDLRALNLSSISIKNQTYSSLSDFKITYYTLKNGNFDGIDSLTRKKLDKIKTEFENCNKKIDAILSNSKNDTISIKQELLKYGNFAVSLINAQNSDEALKALETAAMPVGSYRIKRNNRFNISINAYGGIFGGSETFGGNPKFTYGATAPVGIYLGRGKEQNKVKDNNGNGLGLFVSILDVGSVFALRLSDKTSLLPELAWRNILAPGVNLVYNLGKYPVTIMAGVQHGPELRSFNTVKNTTSGQDELKTVIDSNAWRFHISAVIDIPVFNIYTKANKR